MLQLLRLSDDADKWYQIKVFWAVILRQCQHQPGQASPHYVMSFALHRQPICPLQAGGETHRLAPDSQQSYGPTLSWSLFALWALPALLPIKILTCRDAWMWGSAGRSSYWKMPDILVKYYYSSALATAVSAVLSCGYFIWAANDILLADKIAECNSE